MAIDAKPVVISSDYYENKAVALERGLIIFRQVISHDDIRAKLIAYNESLIDRSGDMVIYKAENPDTEKEQIAAAVEIELMKTRQKFSPDNGDIIIYNAKNSEKAEIELARQALIDRLPIEVPEVLITVPMVESTALDEAMALIQGNHPGLAAQLNAQFKAMQETVKRVPKNKKITVVKSEKILASVAKMKGIYEEYLIYRSMGKIKSQATLNVATDRESSPGAIHFFCISYYLYKNHPEIAEAVDRGDYLTTALGRDGVNKDRSAIISEKLGITVNVSIDY